MLGESRKSQVLFVFDGIFLNAGHVITSGLFLSGFIILLDGSDLLVGLLSNSISWCGLVGLFAFSLYERSASMKKLIITLNIIWRFMLTFIIFLPLVSGNNIFSLKILAIMVIVGNISYGFLTVGHSIWLMSSCPKDSRNSLIFTRIFWLRIAFTIVSLTMGFVLDFFKKSYTGFLIVYIIGLIFAVIDIIIQYNIEEPEVMKNVDKVNLAHFFDPLKDKKYRDFMIFIFFFYISLNISGAFTSVYLLRYLKLSYSFISIVTVVTNICMVLFTRVWGHFEAKRGHRFVIRTTALFMATEFLLYSFLTNKTYFLFFLAPILSGIGNSGFNVSVFTYRYELMPEKNRTVYEGWFNAIFGVSILLAPVIGNILLKVMPIIENSVYQFSNFQLLYLLSFILAAIVVFITFFKPRNVNRKQEIRI